MSRPEMHGQKPRSFGYLCRRCQTSKHDECSGRSERVLNAVVECICICRRPDLYEKEKITPLENLMENSNDNKNE